MASIRERRQVALFAVRVGLAGLTEEINLRALSYKEYGDINVLELGDTSRTEIADDEVLIRVRAASLNPFDWKLRSGSLREVFELGFPITPGRDGCGEVVRLGDAVQDSQLEPGQLVSFISSRLRHGALAEFVAVQARDFVVPVAENLTLEESAALPLVGLSAWNALIDTAELRAGMRVLIHGGSGGVGSAAIQIARHYGADVYATCHSVNVERVELQGAQAIPYDSVDFTTAVSDCDLVFDTVGGQVHEDSYKVLKRGGRLVYLLAIPFNDLSSQYGVSDLQVNVLGETANLKKLVEFAAQDLIKPDIGDSLQLAEFKDAFQLAESGKAGGKIVLTL